jgi:hypothetical protein
MRTEIRKLVKRVLLESDSLGAARERALQIAKDVTAGDPGEQPNTNQISGYDKEYVVIGRTFDKSDDLAGHKYNALYTMLVNKNEDEIVINRLNLGTGDGATFIRTNMDGFGRDSRIPSVVRDILYDYFGIPDPLMSSF